MEGDGLLVRKIRDGTVIDHIPAGRSLMVLRLLGITGREGLRVAVVMNVESKKLGRKDIVKIEGRELRRDEVDVIAFVAPTATINIIKDYKVVSKFRVSPPREISGVFRCVNPTCISNKPGEPITPRLVLVDANSLTVKCWYCGTVFRIDEVMKAP